MDSKLNTLLLIVFSLAISGCAGQSKPGDIPVLETEITVDPGVAEPGPSTAPALLALISKANTADNPQQAIAYIERAIRIDEARPDLWTQLAQLHLQIKEPVKAEQLARKAVALAGRRLDFARDAWLTLADAKALAGDFEAAEKIRRNWRSYRG